MWGNFGIPVLIAILISFQTAAAAVQEEEQVDATALIARSESLMRSSSAFSEMTMEIITPDWRRSLSMRSWDDREGKRSFIHILSPARDKDTTFLRIDYQLWMYLPRAERVVKIPPSMMLQSWMGSDYNNDDLVRESSVVDDYTHQFLGYEEIEGRRCYLVRLTPKPDVPVTWGGIEAALSVEPFVPVRFRYYNRRDELRKTMILSELQEMDGRLIPTIWTMRTEGKEGHATVITVDNIDFDIELDDGIFTQRYLKNPR